jgi:cupin 2 domain-containing protein
MEVKNLLQDIPKTLPGEFFETLAQDGDLRIERIVSEGHTTPEDDWYDQAWTEWVLVLEGRAELLFEGDAEPVSMGPMDHVLIPPRRRHRVSWTAPDQRTVWLSVHFPDKRAD